MSRAFFAVFVVASVVGCGKSESTRVGKQDMLSHPTTIKEFKNVFTAAYEKGDKERIGSLVRWTGSPPDFRKGFHSFLLMFAGKHKVTSFMIRDINDPDSESPSKEYRGRPIRPNVTILYFAVVETAGNAGIDASPSKFTMSFFLGFFQAGSLMKPDQFFLAAARLLCWIT